ncbi:MAG: hypothetical protein JO001_24860 [Alphaproteobacteria bacterium]|nr:hypothetical protein [Alphaproteobacteria bacterium]
MTREPDKDELQRNLDAKIAEAKDGIARLIAPHATLPGSGGTFTIALLELDIERHLDRFPGNGEKAARDLVNGVVTKVLKRRNI